MMSRVKLALLLMFLVAGSGYKSWAASCQISAVAVNFGTYTGALSRPGASQMTVNCTSGTDYDVGLSAGSGSGASVTTRKMTSSASGTLNYQLFQNAARTVNWGNTAGTDSVSGTGTGAAQTLNVYPQAAANQAVAPGTYTDTIAVTLSGSQSKTTSFTVTATVSSNCTLSVASVSFGNYTGARSQPGATPITLNCTSTVTFNIGLDAGQGSGATTTTRKMTSKASGTLNYQLFQDSARTTNWGNTVGTDTVSGTGTGASQTVNIYPSAPAGQSAAPGTYSDTVIATLTY